MAISGTDLLEAYFWGNISTKYGQKYGTFTYIHFRILKFPLNLAEKWWFDDFSEILWDLMEIDGILVRC